MSARGKGTGQLPRRRTGALHDAPYTSRGAGNVTSGYLRSRPDAPIRMNAGRGGIPWGGCGDDREYPFLMQSGTIVGLFTSLHWPGFVPLFDERENYRRPVVRVS